jgi:hypothetical protein
MKTEYISCLIILLEAQFVKIFYVVWEIFSKEFAKKILALCTDFGV